MNRLTPKLVLLLTLIITSCIVLNNRVSEVDLNNPPLYATKANLRIHFTDGSVINSAKGLQVVERNDSSFILPAAGAVKYDLHRDQVTVPKEVNLSEIAFMENYSKQISAATIPATVAGILGALTASVIIFGSCPTYYSIAGASPMLEGEGFSYGITSRFEEEDLDKVVAGTDLNGIFPLQLRNEAWETHYINQLQLITVDHPANLESYVTIEPGLFLQQKKAVILIGQSNCNLSIRNKEGNNVSALLMESDGTTYRSGQTLIQQMADDSNLEDWLEIEFMVPESKKEIFLKIKLRNTLLNSLLFYEKFLDQQNFGAIDWLDGKSTSALETIKFYRWYTSHFGLKIDHEQDGDFYEMTRVRDTGPTAWSNLGFSIPVNKAGRNLLRLRFIPDNWEIDWVGISFEGTKHAKTSVADLASVRQLNQNVTREVQNKLVKSDQQYLTTYPGEAYELDFSVKKVRPGMQRSYFILSEGFYTEWLRTDWLNPALGERYQEPLILDDNLVRNLYRSWVAQKEDFECAFFESRLPTYLSN
jgi:hypothetical protein